MSFHNPSRIYLSIKNVTHRYFVDEFVISFVKVFNLPLFDWIPKLIDGYKKARTNFDDSKGAEMVRRLTIISKERAKIETEKLGFDSTEYDSM